MGMHILIIYIVLKKICVFVCICAGHVHKREMPTEGSGIRSPRVTDKVYWTQALWKQYMLGTAELSPVHAMHALNYRTLS